MRRSMTSHPRLRRLDILVSAGRLLRATSGTTPVEGGSPIVITYEAFPICQAAVGDPKEDSPQTHNSKASLRSRLFPLCLSLCALCLSGESGAPFLISWPRQ